MLYEVITPRTDREVAKELEKSFRKQGIRVLTSAPAKGLDRAAGALIVSTGGKEERLPAEKFLVAVGRKPLTEGLGLEACGVKLTKGYRITSYNVCYTKLLRANVGVTSVPDPDLAKLAAVLEPEETIPANRGAQQPGVGEDVAATVRMPKRVSYNFV